MSEHACPVPLRLDARLLRSVAPDSFSSLDVLYVVGGLFGNVLALDRVLELFEREQGRKRLVFNGDFHWFDADTAVFQRIQQQVLWHGATCGDIEAALAHQHDGGNAGCGFAYPSWETDGFAGYSMRILSGLRSVVTSVQQAELRALPFWLRADVGNVRIAIVHGDATSLCGGDFAQEGLRDETRRTDIARWMESAELDVVACTHTCLPVFQAISRPRRWVLNNGSAGMPNFRSCKAGLLTRIATRPFDGPERLYSVRLGQGITGDAIAIDFDLSAWRSSLNSIWPPDSALDHRFFDRIVRGPEYAICDAVR